MARVQWKQDYEALLRDSLSRGEVHWRGTRDERRDQPRFRLRSQQVFIAVQPRFDVLDVSISGISIYSDFPFRLGEGISVSLGKAVAVDATVVQCELVEAYPDLLETKYHVRCQFADETVGMQFLVLMKQMDDLEGAPHPAAGQIQS